MEHRVETLSFGHKFGEPFHLETRFHEDNPELKHRTLFHGTRKIKAEKRTLDLLAILLQNPLIDFEEKAIGKRLWAGDPILSGNVEQQIYRLRAALGDDPKAPRFIETIPRVGYRFMVAPEAKTRSERPAAPDTEGMRVLERWDHEAFVHFLRETKRGDEADEEEGDLRILTTAFSGGVPDVLADLLEQNVRIKILVMNEALIRARNKVRPYHQPDNALKTLRDQLDTLDGMKKRSSRGTLDVRESNVMPCGFVAHSRNGALLGVFLATESYVRGPMIEIGPGTKLWGTLRADWKALWQDTEGSVRTAKRIRR
jgi:DNA-binding winged helix-turn-helix (wHTH) protein